MENIYTKTKKLLGDKSLQLLKKSRIAVFGIGGVGGYAIEALARTGIGSIDIIDNDNISASNLNRQIIALNSTIGKPKTEIMRDRIYDINPEIKVTVYDTFFKNDTATAIPFADFDYIIDAIDTVSSKIELILKAKEFKIPIISCMGTGNKLEPTLLEVTDIFKTSVCPLARIMRTELKKRNITKLKVVYSKEQPIINYPTITENGKHPPSSAVFVPATAGLILANEVVKEIISKTI